MEYYKEIINNFSQALFRAGFQNRRRIRRHVQKQRKAYEYDTDGGALMNLYEENALSSRIIYDKMKRTTKQQNRAIMDHPVPFPLQKSIQWG